MKPNLGSKRFYEPRELSPAEPAYRPPKPYGAAEPAPEGFRWVEQATAVMELGRPYLERHCDDEEKLSRLMQVFYDVFFYAESETREAKQYQLRALNGLQRECLLTAEQAWERLVELKKRHSYLFPKDKQPLFMGERLAHHYLRKEYRGPFPEVSVEPVDISEQKLRRDSLDEELLSDFVRYLEVFRAYFTYDEEAELRYEDGKLLEELLERKEPAYQNLALCFRRWLEAKGVFSEHQRRVLSSFGKDFAYFLHDDTRGSFASFEELDEEFFIEYFGYDLLSENIEVPVDYLWAPQATLLFLQFAADKDLWKLKKATIEFCSKHGRLFQSYVRSVFGEAPG